MKYLVTVEDKRYHNIAVEAHSKDEAAALALGKFWVKAPYDPWATQETTVTLMEDDE